MHECKPVDTPLPGGWRKEDATSAGGSGSHCLSTIGGVTYVSGQYMTRYMLCC